MVYVSVMYANSMATVYLRHTSGMAQVCQQYQNSMRRVSDPYASRMKLISGGKWRAGKRVKKLTDGHSRAAKPDKIKAKTAKNLKTPKFFPFSAKFP